MAEIRFCTLASGSSGNCVYAEHDGGAVLVDAGISGKRIAEGLKKIGRDGTRLSGVILTHDHHDHISAAGVMARRYKIPLCMSRGTFSGCKSRLGKVELVQIFKAGDTFTLGGFTVETLPTPHDGEEPTAIILSSGKTRVGVLTDLGHPFDELRRTLATLDAAVLESNYDPQMLKNGPYPYHLQQRIRSDAGHISNAEAGMLVREHGGRLKAVLLAHLSQNNNTPELALSTFHQEASDYVKRVHAWTGVAPRHEPSLLLALRG